MRILMNIALILLGIALVGCSSSDSTVPQPAARIPVINQITNNDAFESNPMVSPDGQWVLFESDISGNMDIWRVPVTGGTAEQLTTDPAFDSSPDWSPSGDAIVFESERSGVKDIWVLDLVTPGAVPVALTNAASEDGSPTWSPSDDFIAFESDRDKAAGSDMWLVPVGGGDVQRLTTSPDGSYSRSADWSPDGSHLVFESNRDGFSALYTVTSWGLDITQITFTNGYEGHPAWSPDGSQIAFESTWTGLSEIYAVPFGGGEVTQVTTNGGFWPTWAGDGTKIYYCNYGSSETNVWVVNVDW